MWQRSVTTYLAGKLKDELLTPKDVETAESDAGHAKQHDPLDGEMIRDAEGRTVGRAIRVPNVACYVVGASRDNGSTELERALNDPDTQTIIHWEDDRIAALVFVPSSASGTAESGMRGFRADDV